jgi:hypothetical protein
VFPNHCHFWAVPVSTHTPLAERPIANSKGPELLSQNLANLHKGQHMAIFGRKFCSMITSRSWIATLRRNFCHWWSHKKRPVNRVMKSRTFGMKVRIDYFCHSHSPRKCWFLIHSKLRSFAVVFRKCMYDVQPHYLWFGKKDIQCRQSIENP